ncbi:MAG: helix-hairpin-helix domain-containing protein [Candidatus Aureabacteria bacterium]|nr:helix-hairpin-helix domain-containing protein [Candidatus Auribacterota bacterium]
MQNIRACGEERIATVGENPLSRRRRHGLSLFLLAIVVVASFLYAGDHRTGKAALRCWRCGELFVVEGETAKGECPSCQAPYERERGEGTLRVCCIGTNSGACSFIVRSSDNATLVFTGGEEEGVGEIVKCLAQMGTEDITVMIGAEAESGCMRALTEIMKRFTVRELFDPGFRNDDEHYAEFLKELGENNVRYRVVRAMENISWNSVRFYIVRPSAFAAAGAGSRSLSLCVVHGGNSFLLSHTLRGQSAASLRRPLSSKAHVSDLLFQGSAASLRAIASPFEGKSPIVVESNGREIGVSSIAEISIMPEGEGRGDTAGGTEKGTAQPKGSKSAGKRGASGERININKAAPYDLEGLSGIGAKKAATIIEFRNENGPFRSVEDIKKVPGIGEKLFERNQDRIRVD